MRIHFHSLAAPGSRDAGAKPHLEWLAALAAAAPGGARHALARAPDDADAVVLTGFRSDAAYARALLGDPVVRAFADRLFVHSEEPRPLPALPGAYTSLPASPRDRWISRAIGYPCWSGALNPLVTERAARSPEPREPDLLYSFVGKSDSHPVRRRLFAARHPAGATLLEDTRGRYRHGARESAERHRAYLDVALRSKFALCPRGWATSTLRVYEMMSLGVAPVILADRWTRPLGPRWEECALFVPERDVARLPEIVAAAEPRWRVMGDAARAEWERWFALERQFDTLGDALADLAPHAGEGRRLLRRRWPAVLPTLAVLGVVDGVRLAVQRG